jgi:hypothetical protein
MRRPTSEKPACDGSEKSIDANECLDLRTLLYIVLLEKEHSPGPQYVRNAVKSAKRWDITKITTKSLTLNGYATIVTGKLTVFRKD